MKEVNPRLGMVTHIDYDEPTVTEAVAGIRAHWDGLFAFGAPDGFIVNVHKDAIWVREAAMPDSTGMAAPNLAELFGADENGLAILPSPRRSRDEQQEQLTRDLEIDSAKYYPPDVERDLLTELPDPMEVQFPVKKKDD